MGSYKVIFRADTSDGDGDGQITWEPGCPLMFEALQVSRNTDTGEAYLQAKVINICPNVINSFTASFTCGFSDGSTENVMVSPLDADILGACSYEIKPQRLTRGDAESVCAVIESVQADSQNWTSTSEPNELPQGSVLDLPERLLNERSRQLAENGCRCSSEAARHPVDKYDGWALCPCGQPVVGISTCPRCGLNLTAAIAEDPDSLAADLDTRSEKEKKRHDEIEKNRRKVRRVGMALGTIACASLLFWFFFVSVPEQEASNALAELGGYNDAQPNEVQRVVDEYYGNMSEDDKVDALELLGVTKAIQASIRKYTDRDSEADYFDDMTEVHEEDDGRYRVRTYIREDTENNGWFYWTNDIEFSIDVENGTVEMGEVEPVNLGLIGFDGI